MHPDYRKLCEFELTQVDEDISALFKEIGPGYHGLPTQMQIARYLKELVVTLKNQIQDGNKSQDSGSNR